MNNDNPTIAQTFFRAGYVEAWGRGSSKMCDACKSWGQPMPEYVADPGGLRLLFHALPTSKEMQISDGGQKTNESSPEMAIGGPEGGQKGGQKNRLAFFANNVRYVFPEDSTQAKITLAILDDPYITQSTLTKQTGINRSAIQKHLDKLKEYGILRRVGSDKGGHWECIAPEVGSQKGGAK